MRQWPEAGGPGHAGPEMLTRWKDADPGIPILKQAKAEYEKVK
jgi:hypothetical protein